MAGSENVSPGNDPLPDWNPEEQLSQWLRELHLMKSYATSEGMAIPASAAERLGELTNAVKAYYSADAKGVGPTASPVQSTAGPPTTTLEPEPQPVKAPEPSAAKVPAPNDIGALIAKTLEVHALFSAIVAPATPRTLQATGGDQSRVAKLLGNKLVSWMLFATMLGLILFIASVIGANGETSILRQQLSFVGAAIIGATFYSLFMALKYIVSRTYDSQYGTVYVVRFLLGVVAGVILANFGKDLIGSAAVNGIKLGGALFALIGGYSAEVVNQILMRVSETLLASIKGSGDNQVKTKEQELKTAKAQALSDKERERTVVLDGLASLARDIDNAPPADIKKRIEDFRKKL